MRGLDRIKMHCTYEWILKEKDVAFGFDLLFFSILICFCIILFLLFS